MDRNKEQGSRDDRESGMEGRSSSDLQDERDASSSMARGEDRAGDQGLGSSATKGGVGESAREALGGSQGGSQSASQSGQRAQSGQSGQSAKGGQSGQGGGYGGSSGFEEGSQRDESGRSAQGGQSGRGDESDIGDGDSGGRSGGDH